MSTNPENDQNEPPSNPSRDVVVLILIVAVALGGAFLLTQIGGYLFGL